MNPVFLYKDLLICRLEYKMTDQIMNDCDNQSEN
jgi:hypothetical protein